MLFPLGRKQNEVALIALQCCKILHCADSSLHFPTFSEMSQQHLGQVIESRVYLVIGSVGGRMSSKICILFAVADNYGVMAYAVYLFLLTIWWGKVWGDATACPYIHFESAVEGAMQPLEVAVRTVAETFGGVAVFK